MQILTSFVTLLMSVCWCAFAFSALTRLVGWQEGQLACKNWVMRYWHGYLSAARCKWFAYGPSTATHISWYIKIQICLTFLVLAYLNWPRKEAVKLVLVGLSVCLFVGRSVLPREGSGAVSK